MLLTRLTITGQEPITLAEAKDHLRVDFTDDDTYITALISVAREYAENFQHRVLVSSQYQLVMDAFPYAGDCIKLPVSPLVSVDSITYKVLDGTVKTLNPAQYVVKSDGKIIPAFGQFFPVDVLVSGDGVKVTFTAGYSLIPKTTKQALLLLMGVWYENREGVQVGRSIAATKIPHTADALLWMDRWW